MKRHLSQAVLALLSLVLLALAAGACTMEETTQPPLAGPSEFALGITVHASPDSILQDGVSQSIISIDPTATTTSAVQRRAFQRSHGATTPSTSRSAAPPSAQGRASRYRPHVQASWVRSAMCRAQARRHR